MSNARPYNPNNLESKEHNHNGHSLAESLLNGIDEEDYRLYDITVRHLSDPNRPPNMRVLTEAEKKKVDFVIGKQAAEKGATLLYKNTLDKEKNGKVIQKQYAEAARLAEARRLEEPEVDPGQGINYAPLLDNGEVNLPSRTPSKRLQSFINSILYDNKLGLTLWPFVFYGLLLHDVIEYSDKPNERFGNTLSNIFLGLPLALPKKLGYVKTNQLTYLNHMGSDDVNEVLAYWGGMGAVFITPILTIAIQKAVLKLYGSQAADRDDEITRRKLSHYLLIALSGYAYGRYIELVLQKGAEEYYYHQEKAECEINRKIYSYITEIADYACSICGDWEDVKVQVNAMNDPQSCLNALLSGARDPELILKHLESLKKYAITEKVDLSEQDFSTWSDQIFNQVLNKFSSSNLGLKVFKTSGDKQTLPISTAKLTSISRFIKTHKVVTFDGTNMFVGSHNSQILISGLNNTYTQNVLLGNINLENKGADTLASIYPFTQFQNVEIPNNKINDLGIEHSLENISPCTKSINYGENPLTGKSFVAIVESARKNNQTKLGLSSFEDISSESIQDAFEELGFPKSITNIDVSGNNWGENQIVTFSPYLLASQLEVIIASGNDFSSNDSADVFFNSLPMTLKVLDLSKTQLTEYGTTQLKLFLEHRTVTTIIISDNNFTLNGFKNILDGSSASNVTHLDISKCQLTDDYADILIDYLDTHKGQLISINLETNQLTDVCSTKLVNAFNRHGINKFNINDNLFSNKVCFAIAENLSNSHFTSVSMSKNKVDGDCIVSIVAASADTPLEKLIADDILTLGTDNENRILQNLVRSDYDLSYLANNQLNKDEKRALSGATPNTNLRYLSLLNAGITPAGQYKFFLISSPAGFTSDNLRVSGKSSLFNSQIKSTPFLMNPVNDTDLNTNPLRSNSSNTDSIILQLSGAALLIFLLYQIISKSYSACNRNTLFSRNRAALTSDDLDIESQKSAVITIKNKK